MLVQRRIRATPSSVTATAESKAIMGKYVKIDPSDKWLEAVHEFYAKRFNSKYRGVSRKGISFIIEQMTVQDKSWSDWSRERFYDNRIVEKLKQEGFLEAVYMQVR